MMLLKTLATVVLAASLTLPARGQVGEVPQSASDRPTIALVLSGGAAKGMAHVGAIQVFEAEGIPIDVVAGTSAGALIGSFYAVGYNGHQIEAIIRGAGDDLNDLFFDRVDNDLLRIEETRIPNQTLLSLPLQNGKPRLPEGIVAGQRVMQLLSYYTWGYHQTEDFSQLPRPFICNAVDLVTGKDISLTSGFLPEVARGCISLPGFFEPLERDSMLVIDGGVSRNLPVIEAQQIGGEALVGVDVSGDLDEEGDVQLGPEGHGNSMLFNLTKNLTIRRRAAVLDLRGEMDLIVDPVTGGVSAYDFNNAWLYIERGRQAARELVPEIRAFLDSLDYPQPRKVIEPPTLAPVMVDEIEIIGVEGPDREIIERLLRFQIPRLIGPADMDHAVSRIYATGLFKTIVYKMIPGANAATIRIFATPREYPNTAGVGLRYDDVDHTSLLMTVALRNKIRYGSTTALVFRLGKQLRTGVEYFSRLGLTAPVTASASLDFRSGTLRYGSILTGLFPEKDSDRPILRQNLVTGSAGLGLALTNKALVGFRGVASRYVERIQQYPITDAELLFVNGQQRAPDYEGAKFVGQYQSAMLYAEARYQNRKAFPSRGYRLQLQAELGRGKRNDDDVIDRLRDLFGPIPASARNNQYREFRQYVVMGEWMQPFSRTFSVSADLAWVRGDGNGLPISYYSAVGGMHSTTVFEGRYFTQPGLEQQALLGTNAWKASAGIQYEFRKEKFLQMRAHMGDAYFDLDMSEEEAALDPQRAKLDGFDLERATLSGSVSLGMVSPLGPAILTLGKAEEEPVRIGFSIGYAF